MKTLFGKYMLWLTIVMLVLQLATLGVLQLRETLDLTPLICISFITVFYVISCISGYLLIKAGKQRAQVLVRAVMGSTVLKFFLYMIVLAVIMLTTEVSGREVAYLFFFMYLSFTVFEKTFILKSLKNNDLSNSDATS